MTDEGRRGRDESGREDENEFFHSSSSASSSGPAQASKKSRRARLPDGAAGVRVRAGAVRGERASGRVRERAGGASAYGLRKQGARETLRRRTGADVVSFQGSCLNIVNLRAKLLMCMARTSLKLLPQIKVPSVLAFRNS